MTRLELGSLISRAFALYCVVYLFCYTMGMGLTMTLSMGSGSFLSALFQGLIFAIGYAIAAWILWFKSDLIGGLLTGASNKSDQSNVVSHITFEQALSCVFVFAGLVFLMQAIPRLAFVVNGIFTSIGKEDFPVIYTEYLFTVIFYCSFALTFIFGAKNIARGISHIRTKGVDVKDYDA